MVSPKAALLAAIEADRDAHVAFLQDFLRAPCPNPPGDTREAADVIARYLRSHHIEPEIIAPVAENPNVCAEFNGGRGSGKRLILNGHIDVFPAGDGHDWKRDPWSGDRDEDGNLHGRGAVDMKAGTAASIIAYAYLHARREQLAGTLGLNAVSDEETGGKWGTKWLLDNQPERWRGDCVLNAEPGSLWNVRFGEKGTLRLTFTVRTVGTHGAYLHQSKGAIRTAAELIGRLIHVLENIEPDLPDGLKEHLKQKDVREAIDKAMGKGASDIIVSPTVNIGTIKGGLKVNMIPDTCIFEADIRLPIGLVRDQVMAKIHEILKDYPDSDVKVQEAASNPPNSCAHDHEMVGIITRNAEQVTGIRPVATPSLGATDCKNFRYRGVPAYIYGVSPEGMGGRDECVKEEEFLAVVKTHVLSAWDYLGGGE